MYTMDLIYVLLLIEILYINISISGTAYVNLY